MALRKLGEQEETKAPPIVPGSNITNVAQESRIIKNDKHLTLIKPHNGKFAFIVDCICHWQGRTDTIAHANDMAEAHMREHVND